jgi:hypothetical protein
MSRPSIPSVQDLLTRPDDAAWAGVRDVLASVWSPPYAEASPLSEIKKREDIMAPWDLLLSHTAWELWRSLGTSIGTAAEALGSFWASHGNGKAILILDCLSLREWPILLQEATRRGLSDGAASPPKATTLPPDTNAFARSIGFPSRGALDNNGAKSAQFQGAWTASNNLPWVDAAKHIAPQPSIIYWHHWPDDLIHQFDGSDGGLDRLIPAITKELRSDDFWQFVKSLASGRHLVITSDHGYANTGAFHNADAEQKEELKAVFSAQRFRNGVLSMKDWLPPLALTLNEGNSSFTAVLGRRKWQVPGGFPTLSHGGLTLMEAFVPWVQIPPSNLGTTSQT